MQSRDREIKTIRLMIGIYCRGNHHTDTEVCEDCSALLEYAEKRLDACPFKEKPACSACTVHCYTPDRRQTIQAVMRYAGPRMVLHDPLAALNHALRQRRLRTDPSGDSPKKQRT
jgi:predicted amidophosphoribosyltransferase